MGEELQVSQIIAPYDNTIDSSRSYMTGMVAASLVSLDGQPLYIPLGKSDTSAIHKKFEYINKNFDWPLIQYIYERYIELYKRVEDATEEFKKK
jgi:hypothetical protein